MRRLFVVCMIIYIALYAFEGLARYGLYLVHADSLILGRDALIIVPIIALFIAQMLRAKIDPVYPVFAFFVAIHGVMGFLNIGQVMPVLYGAKLLLNVLFGMLAAPLLVTPGRSATRWFAFIWTVSLIALLADKGGVNWPWTGLQVNIAGVNVDVARDWQITDDFDRRVAGLSRSSISAAMLMPMLATILCFRTRRVWLRGFIVLATCLVVFLTTQKGALLAMMLTGFCIMLPGFLRVRALRLACFAAALGCIAAPLLTQGMMLQHGDGVFSLGSFAMRITDTWPRAMQWIMWNDNFPFGVGLGGIGGPQRLYAPDFFNPADNLFVFMYAFFGVFGVAYLLGLGLAALRARIPAHLAEPTLALLCFMLAYGTVLSMVEDQMAALAFGATAGALWQRRNAWDWREVAKKRKLRRPRMEPALAGAFLGTRP